MRTKAIINGIRMNKYADEECIFPSMHCYFLKSRSKSQKCGKQREKEGISVI